MNKENGENNEGEGKKRGKHLSALAALFVPTIRLTLQPLGVQQHDGVWLSKKCCGLPFQKLSSAGLYRFKGNQVKKTLLIAIALVLALPVASRADSNIHVISTRQLADACKLVADSEHKAFCVGYVSATYETYLVSRHPKLGKDFICHPDPAPRRDEVISDFVKWSDDHKQYDSSPAADNVLRFLAERFPCKRAS